MAGEYTVKILNSDEFNKLPFKRIQENPGSVYGAADKKNRVAYVRDTGYGDFTKATIGHEFDELVSSMSPHEEEGIRYKDFSQSLGNFGSNIPVIGKVAGPVLSGFGQVPDLIGTGLSKVGLPSFNLGQASPQAGPTYGPLTQGQSAIQSGINKASQGSFGDAFKSGVNLASNASAGRAAQPTVPQVPNTSNIFDKIYGGIQDLFSGGQTPQVTGGTSVGGKDVSKGTIGGGGDGTQKGLLDQLYAAAPGAGVSMLGNLFAPKVKSPDFSGIREDLASRIGEGGSPAFDLGFGEAKRILNQPFGELPPELFAPIDERLAQNIEALESQFRSNQQSGQTSIADTTRFGELRNDLIDQAEKEKAQLEFAYRQQQEQLRAQTMTTLLNLDQAQYEQYKQLAALDVEQLVIQTGIDAQTALEFKQLFGQIGGRMIDSAFQTNART